MIKQNEVPSRCATCGSSIALRDGRPVCGFDPAHGVALGGPGSGWHAEQGHVPGSQGGGSKEQRTRDYESAAAMNASVRSANTAKTEADHAAASSYHAAHAAKYEQAAVQHAAAGDADKESFSKSLAHAHGLAAEKHKDASADLEYNKSAAARMASRRAHHLLDVARDRWPSKSA